MVLVTAKAAFMLLAASCVPIAGCAQDSSKSSIANYETPGNLESKHKIGCIPAAKIKNIYTPADLYKGVAACVAADSFENGHLLFALAGAYGRFDTLRVSDTTAHQALTVIQMQEFESLPQKKLDRLQREIRAIAKDDARLGAICTQIRRIGPPNYVPRYMIQHGLGAFSSRSGSALKTTFDATAGWEKALSSYLHCPAAASVSGR